MKKIIGLFFAVFLVSIGLSTETSAQTRRAFAPQKCHPRGINYRQQNQRHRIVNGIKSGELTARETLGLAREQYQIQHMENRFRRSGDGLSLRERYRLQRELNQASRHIYRQKHDRQDYPRP